MRLGRNRRRGAGAAAIAGWLAASAPIPAVTSAAEAPAVSIPAPDLARAIPLGPAAAGSGEQWEAWRGARTVRNVTQATLTPVLPPPGRATGVAVVVLPGGGFLNLSIDNEGFSVARWLADHGVAAFVLKYRTKPAPRDPEGFSRVYHEMLMRARAEPLGVSATPPEALADAQAALRLVRARAPAWRVDPERVGMMGFSAGAVATLAVALAAAKDARPDFIAPIYGPMGAVQVPSDAPPMFAAVALDDPLMTRGKSLDLIQSWRSAGRPLEVHLYAHGGHGFGMTPHSAATAMWTDEFYAWMKDQGLLRPARR
jgi:acetyl esterase/lipase